jgi:hypothetical protein
MTVQPVFIFIMLNRASFMKGKPRYLRNNTLETPNRPTKPIYRAENSSRRHTLHLHRTIALPPCHLHNHILNTTISSMVEEKKAWDIEVTTSIYITVITIDSSSFISLQSPILLWNYMCVHLIIYPCFIWILPLCLVLPCTSSLVRDMVKHKFLYELYERFYSFLIA